jgi:hypothetical protein
LYAAMPPVTPSNTRLPSMGGIIRRRSGAMPVRIGFAASPAGYTGALFVVFMGFQAVPRATVPRKMPPWTTPRRLSTRT